MRRVKRAAVNIKPRQPYIDWANSLDPDGVKIGVDYMAEGRVYLVEDVPEGLLDVPAWSSPTSQPSGKKSWVPGTGEKRIGRSDGISRPFKPGLRSSCTAWCST